MRILQTPARFFPYSGGVENYVYYSSRELSRRGHRVSIVCADEPPVGSGSVDDIKVKRLSYLGKLSNTNITPALAPLLLREDPDIIHTHLPTPWSSDISAVVSLLKNKPLFLTYHNDISGKGLFGLASGLYNISALKLLLAAARAIFITHSGYLENSLFLRGFRDKLIVSPPGVDFDKFKPLHYDREKCATLFFVSRLDGYHHYKGLDLLLESVEKISRDGAIRLYVAGEGELLGYYRKAARGRGLEGKVCFLGALDSNRLAEYYNRADITVMPSLSSRQEGFGLAALEAMACAKPVVVSSVAGVAREVRDRRCGLVAGAGNVSELTQAISYLLRNPQARSEMGGNAYELVRGKYSWSKHADIVEKEYLRAI
ncbi:MAG: glycosyltransferase family 4 protein [Candidatus Omnitrophota bacterium]